MENRTVAASSVRENRDSGQQAKPRHDSGRGKQPRSRGKKPTQAMAMARGKESAAAAARSTPFQAEPRGRAGNGASVRARANASGTLSAFPGGHNPRFALASDSALGDLDGLFPHERNWRRQPKSAGGWGRDRWGRRETFSKENFLKASCQFIVSERVTAAVGPCLNDADAAVDWSLVEELRVWAGEEPTACPICLYPPTAGKMSPCGHVFCAPCVLHYLALSDKAWRKCPICYEPLYPAQLKSFWERPAMAPSLGHSLRFHLMCRPKGSAEALPVLQEEESDKGRFAKVLGIPDQEILDKILARERRELESAARIEAGTPEVCFIHQALEELEKRFEAVHIRSTSAPVSPPSHSTPHKSGGTVFVDAFYEVVKESYETANDDDDGEKKSEEGEKKTAMDVEEKEEVKRSSEEMSLSPSEESKSAYYFYQASDGQSIFLHPLNARQLQREYGSLQVSPPSIEAKVVELEAVNMTEQFRQRFRYLGHVPLASSVRLAELSLRPPLISAKVEREFAAETKKRAELRRRRAAAERSRAAKAAQWDRALLLQQVEPSQVSAYLDGEGDPPPEIPTLTVVPSAQDEAPPPRPDTPPPFDLARDFGPALGQVPPAASPAETDQSSSSPVEEPKSFASMLRGSSKAVWTKAPTKAAAASPPPPWEAKEDSDPDLPAPSYSNAFGEALATALHRNNNSTTQSHQEPTSGKKKKKKQRETLLFAT